MREIATILVSLSCLTKFYSVYGMVGSLLSSFVDQQVTGKGCTPVRKLGTKTAVGSRFSQNAYLNFADAIRSRRDLGIGDVDVLF